MVDFIGIRYVQNVVWLSPLPISTSFSSQTETLCPLNKNSSLPADEPIHPRVDLYRCAQYRKGFSHVLDLNSCCVDNIEEKSWKCELCGKGSNKVSQVQAHQTAYPQDKASKWNTCDRMFSQSCGPLQKVHTGEKPHKCEVCGKDQ